MTKVYIDAHGDPHIDLGSSRARTKANIDAAWQTFDTAVATELDKAAEELTREDRVQFLHSIGGVWPAA